MLFKRRPKPYARPIVEAIATRAIIAEASGELPHLHMRFRMTDGEEIAFDLNYEQATIFLNQAISAHSVIAPPLKIPRQTYGL